MGKKKAPPRAGAKKSAKGKGKKTSKKAPSKPAAKSKAKADVEPPDAGKRCTLGVVVRKDELDKIHSYARGKGMTTSGLIRSMLVEHGLLESIEPLVTR